MFEQLSNAKLPSLASFRNLSPLVRREMKFGLFFISPWIVGFLLFTLLPTIATFLFTFLDLNITDGISSAPKVVGFANYAQLLKDPQVWSLGSTPGSIWVTIRFALVSLPVCIFLPL